MYPLPVPAWIPLAVLAAVGLSTGLVAYGLFRSRGIKAIVLASTDDAHGYLTGVFKVSLTAGVVFCVIFAMSPRVIGQIGPIGWLQSPVLAFAGVALMMVGTLSIVSAQLNMGSSWRVGIDHENRTALVTAGIYRLSRNPIYLGMLALVAGLFLMAPNAATLTILGISMVAVPTQVRLEEEFLERRHGSEFRAYCAQTRRWI